MAIIFSKSSAVNDDLWNEWSKQLVAVMQDTDSEKNNYEEVLKKIFNVKSSKKFGEKTAGLTEFSDFDVVAEGADGVQDEISEGYSKLITHLQFLKYFVCTAEMAEDSQIDVMKTKAANFIRSYKRSRLQFATDSITSAAATFTYGSKAGIDSTTGDGQALFSTAHPMFKHKDSRSYDQSNVFTNALGTDAKMLNRLANIGRNFKNDSGIVMGYNFDTIIIPGNCFEMEDTIKKIIGSEGEVGTNNNDINTQRGKWKLVVNPLWQAAAGKNPYMIMSSEANNELIGNVFYDRIGLTMKDEVITKNHNLMWSGRARWSCGYNNWRQIILGGADTGTTLE